MIVPPQLSLWSLATFTLPLRGLLIIVPEGVAKSIPLCVLLPPPLEAPHSPPPGVIRVLPIGDGIVGILCSVITLSLVIAFFYSD